MAKRRKIRQDAVARVLAASRRRCCICWQLRSDASEKGGQIAHLDGDPSNNDPENLAFLCLEHHDQYDSRTSQSKGFTIGEVKHYRAELLKALSDDAVRSDRPSSPASDVRVHTYVAIAGVPWGDPEQVLAIQVENHSATSAFIRSVTIEVKSNWALVFLRDYLTKELNARRELRPGESFNFHITPRDLFQGRSPDDLDAAIATDDIGRRFRSGAETFRKVVRALYEGFCNRVDRT